MDCDFRSHRSLVYSLDGSQDLNEKFFVLHLTLLLDPLLLFDLSSTTDFFLFFLPRSLFLSFYVSTINSIVSELSPFFIFLLSFLSSFHYYFLIQNLTHSVVQTLLEFMEMFLSYPTESWDYKHYKLSLHNTYSFYHSITVEKPD